jgi:hypothetical protein
LEKIKDFVIASALVLGGLVFAFGILVGKLWALVPLGLSVAAVVGILIGRSLRWIVEYRRDLKILKECEK